MLTKELTDLMKRVIKDYSCDKENAFVNPKTLEPYFEFKEQIVGHKELALRKWTGHWWPSWTSNPVGGVRSVFGGFDSHALPPYY